MKFGTLVKQRELSVGTSLLVFLFPHAARTNSSDGLGEWILTQYQTTSSAGYSFTLIPFLTLKSTSASKLSHLITFSRMFLIHLVIRDKLCGSVLVAGFLSSGSSRSAPVLVTLRPVTSLNRLQVTFLTCSNQPGAPPDQCRVPRTWSVWVWV